MRRRHRSAVSERRSSRIEQARKRAARAKVVLGAGAVVGFFAATGVAASSHPGLATSRGTVGADDGEDAFVEADELDEQQFGFSGSIGPSSGSLPQVQSSVS